MIDLKHYHPKWSLISRLIRQRRAHNRCEWCGVANALVGRWRPGKRTWDKPTFEPLADDERALLEAASAQMSHRERQQFYKRRKVTRIILTVAHIDRDRTNNRFQNLAALCQRCHLRHDGAQHVANRKYGREWKRSVLPIPF